jgi:hypothetical protein
MYRGRRASSIENDELRVTVLHEGGHIAEVLHKASDVNPLWTPAWDSIEPSTYDARRHPQYGTGTEAKLLAGLMGHNLCLDFFGGPSDEEAAAGLSAHGEASVVPYDVSSSALQLTMTATLPVAQLRVVRMIELKGSNVRIREHVTNLAGSDRPIGWTQHVTIGPPFLENGVTELRASATRSKVLEVTFGAADYLKVGAEFDWPHAPLTEGGTTDLRVFTDRGISNAYTAHLMDLSSNSAFVLAFSPRSRLAFGYVWQTVDFPWMGIWEENRSRTAAPWGGVTLTRGLEFGVSPMPESRRRMIDRGRLFGVPTYRWIPAGTTVEVEYWIVAQRADEVPSSLEWPFDSAQGRTK